eukprot:CAMPEP_0180321372 /NCGR_PEP_ID=MMETSP0988-20121125/36104_1 /TAXON_ID=697907 /ORGANISM="non described non described, Strain CCMP2293" /LENGTH=39 /DNA_ID= /DNA_START= /DNA_END= /DNA_ORIENTATION=
MKAETELQEPSVLIGDTEAVTDVAETGRYGCNGNLPLQM